MKLVDDDGAIYRNKKSNQQAGNIECVYVLEETVTSDDSNHLGFM